MAEATRSTGSPPRRRRDRTHWLYLAVIAAVVLGIVVGFVFPDFAVSLKWLGTAFVGLIRMLIAPVIFCTVVLGIGAIRKAAAVGKIGGTVDALLSGLSSVEQVIRVAAANLPKPRE